MIKALTKKVAAKPKKTKYAGKGSMLGSMKSTLSSTISRTPTGRFFSSAKSAVSSVIDTSSSKSSSSVPVQRGNTSGLSISKQTLEVLHNIDKDLKDLLTALSGQKQREEAAAEEAKDEAAAQQVQPISSTTDTKPEGTGLGAFMSKLGKKLAVLAIVFAGLALPIFDLLKSGFDSISELSEVMKKIFSESIIPFFTEKLPNLFTEEIPDFFMNKLPSAFMDGTDVIKEKFSNMLKGMGDILNNMKSKIGGMILGIADNAVLKFILPSSVVETIKKFGNDMVTPVVDTTPMSKTKSESVNKKYTTAAQTKVESINKKDSIAVSQPKAIAPLKGAMNRLDIPEELDRQIAEEKQKVKQVKEQKLASEKAGNTKKVQELQLQIELIQKNIDGLYKTRQTLTPLDGNNTYVPNMPSNTQSMQKESKPTATPVSNATTGSSVSSASMAATAPDPVYTVNTNTSNINKQTFKKQAELTNPIGNVPEIIPNLGTIANLWYHNASA